MYVLILFSFPPVLPACGWKSDSDGAGGHEAVQVGPNGRDECIQASVLLLTLSHVHLLGAFAVVVVAAVGLLVVVAAFASAVPAGAGAFIPAVATGLVEGTL